jgi:hypothetical protein
VESLEDRCVPATFDVPAGDIPALYAALNEANVNGEADTVNLAPEATYTLTLPGSFQEAAHRTGLMPDGGQG